MRICSAGAICLTSLISVFSPQSSFAEEKELTDDLSRGELLSYAYSKTAGEEKVSDRFAFPKDAAERPEIMFGTDVSHHDGKIDWTKARGQHIRYAYVKATQGIEYNDGTFKRNWDDLQGVWNDEATRVYRGAYHFLSAQGDAKDQAQHFLAKIGTLLPEDLPPTVDLEWDAPAGTDPGKTDRWKALSSTAIIEKVKTWCEMIEAATGKKPIIYTAASWWADRIGPTDELKQYKIWIADYSSKSQLNETPRVLPGYQTDLWQFSERGSANDGFSTNIDVNLFKGTDEQFKTALGVTHTPSSP